MKQSIRKPLLSTSIFLIVIFLVFASQYPLFARPGDINAYLQWLLAITRLA